MQKNEENPEQQNDCCDTSGQNCCPSPSASTKGNWWKKTSAFLVLSLALVLAISAAAKVGETGGTSNASNACDLPSISDFEWMETEEKVAFVLLKGADETANNDLEKKLEKVYLELRESEESAAMFLLDNGKDHFEEVVKACNAQSLPAIVILGHGCQSSVLKGSINSTSLLKAYILASTPAASCAKGSSSCCSKK